MTALEIDGLKELFKGFFVGTLTPLVERYIRARQFDIEQRFRPAMPPELTSGLDKSIAGAYGRFLGKHFPETAIVGEETGGLPLQVPETFWLVDALDGTHNFLAGLPTFGTMCALVEDGIPVFSALFPLGPSKWWGKYDFFYAARGKGAFCSHLQPECGELLPDTPLAVTGCMHLENAFIVFEGPTLVIEKHPLLRVVKEWCQRYRSSLSSCWAGILLASGERFPFGIDGMIACNNKPWDNLPVALLVEEAGGEVTDFEGNPYSYGNCDNLVFSNGRLHSQLLGLQKMT